MVLATDEVFTYAIFNYVNIAWSSHTEAGGKLIFKMLFSSAVVVVVALIQSCLSSDKPPCACRPDSLQIENVVFEH